MTSKAATSQSGKTSSRTRTRTAPPKASKARKSAREAMSQRTRVTFGAAYLRDLEAGTQRDVEKQISHAIALGLGTASKLRKVAPEKIREMLLEEIKKGNNVTSASYVHIDQLH